jgi:hypothetical protein
MRFLTLIISLVAASAAAAAAVTHAHQPASAGGGPELVASVAKRFSITGVPVTGLYPGATRPLTVKVKNIYAFPITIGTLRATVKSSNRPGCTGAAANLQIVATGARTVPIRAHKTKTVVLHVTMPSTVSNACQGARFSLSFSASAKR